MLSLGANIGDHDGTRELVDNAVVIVHVKY